MVKDDGFKKFLTRYKKGDVIYSKDELQENFFILNKGKIQLKVGDDDLILAALSKGDFFGEESLNESQKAAYTVEVIEDADIIKIPYYALIDMMNQSTDIGLKILKKQSEKNLRILENILRLSQPVEVPPPKPKKGKTEDDKTAEKVDPDIKAYLIVQRSNRIVQLTKKQTYLGRRDYTTGFIPDVDLTKEDEEKYISRKHSKISFSDSKFYVSEEPGAVNGTFLNGERLATSVKHELKNEDEITLCHLKITFKY
ncbi:MAG: cyclic nucleotide-binding domain-containing protein [Candidatus Aminicenantes bacterium]|nr:cyclic nucleotide-binding domain-containing protein [Candidatus Aminicenantes bacterium]